MSSQLFWSFLYYFSVSQSSRVDWLSIASKYFKFNHYETRLGPISAFIIDKLKNFIAENEETNHLLARASLYDHSLELSKNIIL